MWRVNAKGQFNVPMGSYRNPSICQPEVLRACHHSLRGVDVRMRDFRKLDAGAGDFVYFDPPYQPLNATSSFTSYAKSSFGEEDQRALRDVCLALHQRGAQVMVSNSDTPLIRALYADAPFKIETVQAPRMVNSKAEKRGAVNELLIKNY